MQRFLSIFTYSFNPASASELQWQTPTTQVESMPSVNTINSGDSKEFPCPVEAKSYTSNNEVPPLITQIGKLSLSHYLTALTWNSSSNKIATGEFSSSIIKVWSFPSLSLENKIDTTELGTDDLAFTNDGNFLIASLETPPGAAFGLIGLKSGKIDRVVNGYENPPLGPLDNLPWQFILSPDGKTLYVTFHGDLGRIYVYDTNSWKINSVINSNEDAMQVGPGPNQLTFIDIIGHAYVNEAAEDSYRDVANVWDEDKKEIIYRSQFYKRSEFSTLSMASAMSGCIFVLGALHTSDGVQDAVPSGDGTQGYELGIRIWYPALDEIFKIAAQSPISSVDFDESKKLFAFVTGDSKAYVVFLSGPSETPDKIILLHQFSNDAYKVSFSKDGNYLAVGGDNSVLIFHIGLEK